MAETGFFKKEVLEIALFVMFFGVMAGIVPILALTLGRGLEAQENFQKTLFYSGLGGIFLVAIIGMKTAKLFITKTSVDGIIHDPEESFFGVFANFKTMLFIGVIIFSIAGLLAAQQNTFLAGILTQQQVTETAQIVLAVEPAVSTETLLILFIASVLITLLNYLERQGNINNLANRVFRYTIVPFAIMIFWVAFHTFRYSTSEVSILNVAFFGFASGVLIVMFNSFLMAYLLHFFNNLYQQANVLFSDNGILVGTMIWLVLFVGFSMLLNFLVFNARKMKESVTG